MGYGVGRSTKYGLSRKKPSLKKIPHIAAEIFFRCADAEKIMKVLYGGLPIGPVEENIYRHSFLAVESECDCIMNCSW